MLTKPLPLAAISVTFQQAITQALNATKEHNFTSVAMKQAITQALNATNGHKCSYQTSYYSDSKYHTGTQA